MANPLESVIERIKSKVSKSPNIHDFSHVGLSVQGGGLKFWEKKHLQIVGRLNRDEELEAFNSIVKEETQGYEVVNTVRVQYRA